MHIKNELIRVVNLLITYSDQNPTTGLLHLFVEHTVEHWIDLLDILNEEWKTESDGGFEILHETVISETCLVDLLFLVVIHDEFEGLVGWINDQRVPVELFDDDDVLNAECVIWQRLLLPNEPLTRSA